MGARTILVRRCRSTLAHVEVFRSRAEVSLACAKVDLCDDGCAGLGDSISDVRRCIPFVSARPTRVFALSLSMDVSEDSGKKKAALGRLRRVIDGPDR